MSNAALPEHGPIAQPASRLWLSIAGVQRTTLFLLIACSAFASIEPSPYEIMFVLALLVFGFRELLFDRSFIPLILGLAMFNAAGAVALVPFVGDHDSLTFIVTSVYIAVTAVFFAGLIACNPLERMRTIRSGYLVAGLIASVFAFIGYFNIGGLGDHFTLYGRASATFKDPNVFGPFLVPPMVWLTQDILLQRRGAQSLRLLALTAMLLGLLLSFSRGAWGVWVGSTALMVCLTFLTARSAGLRQRILAFSLLGLFGIAVLLVVALSIPAIRDVFEIRASLDQDYDLGELGRFGAQWRSIPMLMDRPFGFGPLQYRNYFHDQDPHETFLNAFASYGWAGGLSYLGLVAATLCAGVWLIFRRTPYQIEAIPVCSCLFVQIFQGVQIDSDHWRHLYLLYGAMYGLVAASRLYLKKYGSTGQKTGRLQSHTKTDGRSR
jgi:hypothetical protein